MESQDRGRNPEEKRVTSSRQDAADNEDRPLTSRQRTLLDRLVAILRGRPSRHQAVHEYLEEEDGNTR